MSDEMGAEQRRDAIAVSYRNEPSNSSHQDLLLAFIEHSLSPSFPVDLIKPDSDLQSLGLLDSLSFIDLVAGVEDIFDVQIEDDDRTQENFASINAIVSLVSYRQHSKISQ